MWYGYYGKQHGGTSKNVKLNIFLFSPEDVVRIRCELDILEYTEEILRLLERSEQ